MAEGFPDYAAEAEEHERQGIPSRVAILDAGGQYVDMVWKAVERQGVPADILPLHTSRDELESRYGAVIISGSPASSHAEAAPQPDPSLWESGLPILGICYGMQAMAIAHGGSVARNAIREDGRVTTAVNTGHALFAGGKADFTALFTHGDFVTEVPEGFESIGQHQLSDGTPAYSAIARGNKIGVQFHPEVFDDTPEGYQLFKNFLHGIAGIPPDDSFQEARLANIVEFKRRQIAEQVGDEHVIAFVSGGVDSSVAAALCANVVAPDKFHAYYIDTGFMRDEDDMVIESLVVAGLHVTKVDAADYFEHATTQVDGVTTEPLAQTTDPETKRKIIGKAFVDVQNNILASLHLPSALLLQGTNAADRIESGHSSGGSHTMVIKTHHNQVQEVHELKARGLLIEPIDDLFKDEVRELGRELGLPDVLVDRQPFPGPGTAIRIIAAAEDLSTLESDPNESLIRDFVSGRTYDTVQPVGIHLLPIKSVGVGGDERSHISVVALDNGGLGHGDMARLGTDIPAHFRGIANRVIYALGPRPLAGHSVSRTLLTRDCRDQLRHADRIVFEAMRDHGLLNTIKQLPVILLPLSFGEPGGRSIVLRPIQTNTFMTVQAMLPGRDLPVSFFESVTGRVLGEVPGVTQVFLDLTNKPPGTTEWE